MRAVLKLSAQIRDAVSQANLAVIQVRARYAQLNERMDKVPPRRKAEIQRLVDGLMKPLTAVEEEMYQVKNHSFEDPLNFPIKLNNQDRGARRRHRGGADVEADRFEPDRLHGAVEAARRPSPADEEGADDRTAALPPPRSARRSWPVGSQRQARGPEAVGYLLELNGARCVQTIRFRTGARSSAPARSGCAAR